MQKITKNTYLKWYEDMLFWRKFEDKLAAVYIQQKVRGFLHLYNGQEAVLAGALHAMDLTKDKMITAYRNHVQPIGMGVDPRRVMAELYGKVTGTSKGKGFQGVVKRHGFAGVGQATHGQHNRLRAPGSIGAASYPARVFKGMKMAGRMGTDTVKVQNLRVLKVVTDKNLLVVKGCIPGAKNAYVTIQK